MHLRCRLHMQLSTGACGVDVGYIRQWNSASRPRQSTGHRHHIDPAVVIVLSCTRSKTLSQLCGHGASERLRHSPEALVNFLRLKPDGAQRVQLVEPAAVAGSALKAPRGMTRLSFWFPLFGGWAARASTRRQIAQMSPRSRCWQRPLPTVQGRDVRCTSQRTRRHCWRLQAANECQSAEGAESPQLS